MIADYIKLGVRTLRKRGLRSWLTMIGIFIGIAAVVSLISLGEGMKDAVTGQFASLGTETISVQAAGGGFGPPGTYQSVTIGKDDLKVVQRTRGVEQAFGRMIEPVRIVVDREQEFGFVVSMPDESSAYDLAINTPTPFETVAGRLIRPNDGCRLMVGNNVGEKDVFVRKLIVGDKIQINGRVVEVVGILEKTGNPQLDSTLFLPESCAREVTGIDDKYGVISAKIGRGEDVDAVAERMNRDLRRSRDVREGREDFAVTTSQELLNSVNDILSAVTIFLIGIAGISLLVGGVGITNTMYTSVLERTRDIGIMKAVGARNSDVLTLFLIESGLLGLAGGIVGVILGLGLSTGLSWLAVNFGGFELLRANYSLWLIFGALAFSFIVGSISGILPARQAANMPPVEAFRRG